MEAVADSLTLFRQMKASVRGSEKYLLVGIDVAKNKHHAFFGTPNGRTLRKIMVFDNNLQGFENLRGLAGDLKNQHGLVNVVYGLEPTASYHKPLAEYLLRQKEQVVYVSNVAVERIVRYWMAAGTRTIRRMQPMLLIWWARAVASSMSCRKRTCANYGA